MSILSDAWRRSRGEHDEVSRALGAPPVSGGQGGRHVLPWILCGVLVVILVGLGVYVWRVVAVRGTASADQPRASVQHVKSIPKASAVLPATRAQAGASSAGAMGAMRQPEVAHDVSAKKTVPATTAQPRSADDRSAQTVPDAVRAALPPLPVTVHVWNPQPSARFIIVHGQLYHEGDTLGPELRLVAVTESGEIVNFRGYLITLSGH